MDGNFILIFRICSARGRRAGGAPVARPGRADFQIRRAGDDGQTTNRRGSAALRLARGKFIYNHSNKQGVLFGRGWAAVVRPADTTEA